MRNEHVSCDVSITMKCESIRHRLHTVEEAYATVPPAHAYTYNKLTPESTNS